MRNSFTSVVPPNAHTRNNMNINSRGEQLRRMNIVNGAVLDKFVRSHIL